MPYHFEVNCHAATNILCTFLFYLFIANAEVLFKRQLLTFFQVFHSFTNSGCFQYYLSLLLFNTELVRAISQEKEMNDIQIRKEEIKLSLFADNILYRKP